MEQESVIDAPRLAKKELLYECSFASHEKAKHWSDNNDNITPEQVTIWKKDRCP